MLQDILWSQASLVVSVSITCLWLDQKKKRKESAISKTNYPIAILLILITGIIRNAPILRTDIGALLNYYNVTQPSACYNANKETTHDDWDVVVLIKLQMVLKSYTNEKNNQEEARHAENSFLAAYDSNQHKQSKMNYFWSLDTNVIRFRISIDEYQKHTRSETNATDASYN